MANSGDFAAQLKQQTDIVRVIGEYVQLKRSGAQNFSGLCPFHGEKTASFSVHATRQFFHCFGCGVSGDVFTFVQKIENVTFPEAIRIVAQKMGVPMPKVEYSSPEEARAARTRGVLTELNEQAQQFFRQQLASPEGAAARAYLLERGLDAEACERFGVGYAPDSGFLLRDFLRGKADDEMLRESGLFSWKERDEGPQSAKAALYSKFRNRVMFPICNERGRTIAFTGRRLNNDEKAGPKYLNSPETAIYSKSHVLFNLHLAKEAIRVLGYVILVEGQMDCISVYNAGFHNVIASSGTAFTEAQARTLARMTKNIIINFDPDNAGAKAAERSLAMLVAEDFDIKVVTLEQGYDPDLYVRRKGAEAYGEALRTARRYFDYLVERARQQFAVNTAEGKAKAVNYLLPHIQQVNSRIVRDELAANLAQALQIDSGVLRQELRHLATSRAASSIETQSISVSPLSDAERLVLRALCGGEAQQSVVTDEDGQEFLFDPAAQARYALEQERLHEGLESERLFAALLSAPAPGALGLSPSDLDLSEQERTQMAASLQDEGRAITPELLQTALDALSAHRLKRRIQEMEQEIARLARGPMATMNEQQQAATLARWRELDEQKTQLVAQLKHLRG